MIKAHRKVGMEVSFYNLIKSIYKVAVANIILKGEKRSISSQRSETRQGHPLLHITLKSLGSTVKQLNKYKGQGKSRFTV